MDEDQPDPRLDMLRAGRKRLLFGVGGLLLAGGSAVGFGLLSEDRLLVWLGVLLFALAVFAGGMGVLVERLVRRQLELPVTSEQLAAMRRGRIVGALLAGVFVGIPGFVLLVMALISLIRAGPDYGDGVVGGCGLFMLAYAAYRFHYAYRQ